MTKHVKIAIIGAGTAGLAALKEIKKSSDDVVIIDPGPLGTTCARVGCMPSKALIQIADDFHRRHILENLGIENAKNITINIQRAMQHVRELRDYFVNSVLKSIEQYKKHFIQSEVEFIEPTLLQLSNQKIQAKRVIIATGSHSIVPKQWQKFSDHILTSETIFEQKNFQNKIGVIGTGVIGLELGQALHRFGIETHLFGSNSFIGGLTDPIINKGAIEIFKQEFPLYLGDKATIQKQKNVIEITSGQRKIAVDQVFAAMGRDPNIEKLNLQRIGIALANKGLPSFNPDTLQIEDLPIFITGDSNGQMPLLHEAADEGRIAGYNALQDKPQCFQRRTALIILFTQPNIAIAGKRYGQLKDQEDFVCGEVSFKDQGRARVMAQNNGHLRLYAKKNTGILLGAELIAPQGEHLAHLLAWIIQQQLPINDILQMPFYHPTLEEGVRTALRDVAKKVKKQYSSFELAMCDSGAEKGLE